MDFVWVFYGSVVFAAYIHWNNNQRLCASMVVSVGHDPQLTTTLPGVSPGSASQHLANCVTGNGLAVITDQADRSRYRHRYG